MNEKINADLKSLKFIFNKDKSYIFPIIIFLASILLFSQFVIPQFKLLTAAQGEIKELNAKTEILNQNLNLLSNINDETLGSQLDLLDLALPNDKDFMGVLNAVNIAAQKAGVSIGSFSFQVGNLATSESKGTFPVISLTVPITADSAGANSFIQILSNTFPLSEVNSVKINDSSSVINLSFYYKSVDASGYSQDSPISPISQDGLLLITQMRGFQSASSFSVPVAPVTTITPVATVSAVK